MIVSGKELVKFVENLIYEKKQVRGYEIDLTLRDIYEIEGKGSLDFGGSEYRASGKNRIEPVKEPGERYGWWYLKPKTYLITLNETVKKGFIYFISPHHRLLRAGATHPTLVTMDWNPDYVLPLHVGEMGLNLKENARVSKLFALRIQI